MTETIRRVLDDKKGEEILLLDVRELSSVTDYYLLVTGTNTPHIKALAEEVDRVLKADGTKCFRKSGTAESGWVVADYFDVVLHIFSSEQRAYYALEQLWADAPVVA